MELISNLLQHLRGEDLPKLFLRTTIFLYKILGCHIFHKAESKHHSRHIQVFNILGQFVDPALRLYIKLPGIAAFGIADALGELLKIKGPKLESSRKVRAHPDGFPGIYLHRLGCQNGSITLTVERVPIDPPGTKSMHSYYRNESRFHHRTLGMLLLEFDDRVLTCQWSVASGRTLSTLAFFHFSVLKL